ncbi:carbohydrate ABC transporter permease [Kallotenue papyrolyticum]|uniref:carbohydrate ABC transporter permease n=1 Tax=Kallotenue papyrolyticum TaxID=1325125 RepID=UPI0004926170|nr:carbohydrate ABC transporter permease [Kallotenue papyrolyticum]
MSLTLEAPRRRSARYRLNRALLYLLAVVLTLFILLPIYLITIAAFSPRAAVYTFPKPFVPTELSTDTLRFFLGSTGVARAFRNSLIVGVATVLLSLLIGAPAGYALARFVFPGRDSFKLLILSTRAFPIVILSIPLAVMFIDWRIYDTIPAVVLAHTALALPTTVLVTSSIFLGVPRELEEAAETLGCTPLGAFWRVVLPLALPGLAAAAIFTFVLSWNEVFAATILTVRNRTLPAHVLGVLNDSPLPFQFAGGFALVVPSLVFIFFMRRYLLNMWGRVTK